MGGKNGGPRLWVGLWGGEGKDESGGERGRGRKERTLGGRVVFWAEEDEIHPERLFENFLDWDQESGEVPSSAFSEDCTWGVDKYAAESERENEEGRGGRDELVLTMSSRLNAVRLYSQKRAYLAMDCTRPSLS